MSVVIRIKGLVLLWGTSISFDAMYTQCRFENCSPNKLVLSLARISVDI